MDRQGNEVSGEVMAVRNAIANARMYLREWLDHADRHPNPADAWAQSKVRTVASTLAACQIADSVVPDEHLLDPAVLALCDTLGQARDVVRLASADSANWATQTQGLRAMRLEDDLLAATAALRFGAANCGPFLPIKLLCGAEAYLPARPRSHAQVASMLLGSVGRFRAVLEAEIEIPARHEWHVPLFGRIFASDLQEDARLGISLNVQACGSERMQGLDPLSVALALDPRQIFAEVRLCIPFTDSPLAEEDKTAYRAQVKLESGPRWAGRSFVHVSDTDVAGRSLNDLASKVLAILRPAIRQAVQAIENTAVSKSSLKLGVSSQAAA